MKGWESSRQLSFGRPIRSAFVESQVSKGANLGHPPNSLMQASDGNFYGTALLGGANFDDGTLFRFSLTGQ